MSIKTEAIAANLAQNFEPAYEQSKVYGLIAGKAPDRVTFGAGFIAGAVVVLIQAQGGCTHEECEEITGIFSQKVNQP